MVGLSVIDLKSSKLGAEFDLFGFDQWKMKGFRVVFRFRCKGVVHRLYVPAAVPEAIELHWRLGRHVPI